MYILGGSLKGKKLASSSGSNTRPAMALVRKSIFDSLGDFVDSINVLDLFAGTGSLGIEAISRGAKNLTLIDADKRAVSVIKKNLLNCQIKANVIYGELPGILNRFSAKKQKFDLIFIDPPYEISNCLESVLEILLKKELINANGLISIESPTKERFEIPTSLKLKKERIFGSTKITFLCFEK